MALSPVSRCPGFSAAGSAQRQANSPAAEKDGNCLLLSQGLWAPRQEPEQQLNETRSFDARVVHPSPSPPALEAALAGGALEGLGTEAAGLPGWTRDTEMCWLSKAQDEVCHQLPSLEAS